MLLKRFQAGGEIPSYQTKTYGGRPYAELGVAQRRFLDYKNGYQGYVNPDGTYKYTGVENPGVNYKYQSSVDINQQKDGNNMSNTHSAGNKMSSFVDPETGTSWKVPSQYLGKEYPAYIEGEGAKKSAIGVAPTKKKGGILYKRGGQIA